MNLNILGPQGPRIATAALIIALAALPFAALAANGRDFSATYDVTHVATVDSQHVSVMLNLRLQNHSGADVTDAEVSLRDDLLEFKSLGVFPLHVTLANHAVANLSGTFTVPAGYMTHWRSGPGPHVFVRFIDAHGHSISRPVKLRLMPGVGG